MLVTNILISNMLKSVSKYNGNYYQHSDSLSLFGLEISCCGYQAIHPFEIYPPKKHPIPYFFLPEEGRVLNEYQIVYITEGEGTFKLNDSRIRVCKGDLIFLVPSEKHSYYPDSVGWNEYFVGFSGKAIDSFVESEFIPAKSKKITIGLNNELVCLFQSLVELTPNCDDLVKLKRHGLLMHILGILIYEINNPKHKLQKHVEIIENAKILMSEQIHNHIGPEEIAVKLNVSYSLFRKLFKRQTTYSPALYFQLLKLQKAKQYLVETEMSIKEIAFILKFSCLESFVITFKRQFGETPTQYRKSCRTKP